MIKPWIGLSRPLWLMLFLCCHTFAFYVPGVNPRSFASNERVQLKVNKMTSSKALFDKDYYSLPFCHGLPNGGGDRGPIMDNENLGELLEGDRIESSPYDLRMKTDLYCAQLCLTNLGRGEHPGIHPNRMVLAIRNEYHHNWIVDNLDSASKWEDDEFITTRYSGGFPIGFVSEQDRKAYVHNHVNIELEYHQVQGMDDLYRIVRFTVEPFSIQHQFDFVGETLTIKNPIPSCEHRTSVLPVHTDYDMITKPGRYPQPAAGKVLFTYDVIWVENPDLRWANRWDIYLTMDNPFAHGYGGFVFFMVVRAVFNLVFLLGVLALILRRVLQGSSSSSSSSSTTHSRIPLTDEEQSQAMGEAMAEHAYGRKGWRGLSRDVFRPPSTAPVILSVFAGTGAQLLTTAALIIFFASLGFLNPARRGRMVMGQIFCFAATGVVAGYTSARFYKMFNGENQQRNAVMTALFFPIVMLLVMWLGSIAAFSQGSSDVVPFTTIVVLLFLFGCVHVPLVFLGAYMGNAGKAVEFPAAISMTPRPIPPQPCYLRRFCTIPVSGFVVYWPFVVELHMLISSVWAGRYYTGFGYSLVFFLLLLATCSTVAVLFNFVQLNKEDHCWWWRAFANGGGVSVWVLLYSWAFYRSLGAPGLATLLFYWVYTTVACFGTFLVTGFVGLCASLWFNRLLYTSIINNSNTDDTFGSASQPLFELGSQEEGHELVLEVTDKDQVQQ